MVNIFLWIVQILLALHTITGAVWKYSNPAQMVPSLKAIPNELWLTLSVIELLCSLGLILPLFKKSLGRLAPWAALCIAAEMLLFCAVHLFSAEVDHSPMMYWLVVAVICVFFAYGRFVLKPLNNEKTT
jgi:hypothetical protein